MRRKKEIKRTGNKLFINELLAFQMGKIKGGKGRRGKEAEEASRLER